MFELFQITRLVIRLRDNSYHAKMYLFLCNFLYIFMYTKKKL